MDIDSFKIVILNKIYYIFYITNTIEYNNKNINNDI